VALVSLVTLKRAPPHTGYSMPN